MSKLRYFVLASLFASASACAAETILPASAATNVAPKAEKIAAKSGRVTTGGASVTVPENWSLTTVGNNFILEAPEADTRVAIVDISAVDAKAAVAAAWASYRPDAKLVFKLATPRPAREGWEERQVFDYETSPNDRLVIQAIASRAGNAWTVVILDGTQQTFEKRISQIGLVIQSLRPKGFQRESFAGRAPNHLDAARIAQLKTFIETSMQQLGVPGASIALVDGGKVVFEGGFGVRELGKPARVDANTLFMAASNTKGMTTLLLSELVDEKKIRWNQPVTEIYPRFKLGDAETTKQVLVEHLVCACTGLPRQDLEWIFEFKNATPTSSLELLGTMQPTSRFGEIFQYSNLMAAAAGYVGAHVIYPNSELGAAYDKAMQKKIFDPLGMKSTTFDMARAQRNNHARPHGDNVDGKPAVANMAINYSVMPARPAGGVWTSAHDLIKYVQLELAEGKLPNGKQLVSAENLLARRKPMVVSGENTTYGMGLTSETAWGVPVVYHGGSMAGYKSNIYILPGAGIGAVLLTNADTGERMLRAFMRRLLEVIYDGKPEAAEDVHALAERMKAYLVKERERLVVPADASLVTKLAGRYRSKELGGLTVKNRKDATVFDFGEWHSTVASRRNDDGTISFISIDPTNSGFEFVVGEREGKRVLVTRDGQHEYVFAEMAAAER